MKGFWQAAHQQLKNFISPTASVTWIELTDTYFDRPPLVI
jgi:hypothetical protein